MLDQVRLAAYRFQFRTSGDLYLPPVNKGNTLRGAFGFALKPGEGAKENSPKKRGLKPLLALGLCLKLSVGL